MADLPSNEASSPSRIVGSDELYAVDVFREDGINKLMVKSTIFPQILGDRFTIYAEENGGSNEMDVNGSNTSVDFIINATALGDLVVSSLVFQAFDGGIKIDKFLGLNSFLSNGVLIEVKSEDVVFRFLPITNTIEFDSLFAFGSGRSFELISASGNDSMVSRFGPELPFLIKTPGTYATDDYIKVIVQDDLRSVARLRFLAEGSVDL